MRKRILRSVTLGALLILITAAPALAGGWAVTSVEDAPAEFVPGETYQLHYTVLQHGRTPVDVDDTAVILRSRDSAETLIFEGIATKEVGRYEVEVEIPTTGSWEWKITQGPFQAQELGTLPMQASPTPASTRDTSPAASPLRWLLPAAALATVVLLAVQIREIRRTARKQSPTPEGQAA
jgi:hypothetical protein